MFKLEDFNALTEEGKFAYVQAHGLFVAESKEDEYNIHLYQLHSSYVELWFHPENIASPYVIKSFSTEDFALHQFNALSKDDQAEITWKNGAQIDERMHMGYRIVLFQFPAFYVEIWYHPANHKIDRIRSFSNTDCLQPYLDNVDISTIDDTLNS